tara:strand:- start:3180 stop:3455 length:276 start_codon:yes stop_codon:yes gene_type:complete
MRRSTWAANGVEAGRWGVVRKPEEGGPRRTQQIKPYSRLHQNARCRTATTMLLGGMAGEPGQALLVLTVSSRVFTTRRPGESATQPGGISL